MVAILLTIELAVGMYKITSPERLANKPDFTLSKAKPINKGIPIQSEASTGICQSLSDFLSLKKALIS